MRRSIQVRYILASSSPRRRQLLRLIGIEPEVRIPAVDEVMLPDEALEDFLRRVTEEKAGDVYEDRMFDSVVVSADTVVVLDDMVIGKPSDRQDAGRMLSILSGRRHDVWTGVGSLHRDGARYGSARTSVYFDTLTETQIDRYLDHEHYMDKAGAYAIQGRAAAFVQKIDGCFFTKCY